MRRVVATVAARAPAAPAAGAAPGRAARGLAPYASSSGGARGPGGPAGGEAEVDGFDWEDDRAVAALRARLRRTLARRRGDERDGRADLAPPIDPPARSTRPSSSAPGPADSVATFATRSSFGWRDVVAGGRFGYGATPPWERARSRRDRDSPRSPAYDPAAFASYFARRPGVVLRRAGEIALRLGDVGARAYFKRGEMRHRAARLRDHLAALGPAFVKIGQILSTRADLLPPVYCRELAKLQDDLPPAPRRHAIRLLSRELAAKAREDDAASDEDGHHLLAELFEPSEPSEPSRDDASDAQQFASRRRRSSSVLPAAPIAAASLAQVYKVRLAGGGPWIALKLRRPGVAASLALDATILRAAGRVARAFFPLRSDVVGIVDELIGRVFDEMDYERELRACRRFADTYAPERGQKPRRNKNAPPLDGFDDPLFRDVDSDFDSDDSEDGLLHDADRRLWNVRAPRVLPELSSASVLAMEWVDGTRVDDVAALRRSGVDPLDALDRGVRCSLHQLLVAGFMHADPHPGNLIVAPGTGALTYVDFGSVVTIEAAKRRAMIGALVGFVNRDAAALVRDLVVLDFLPADADAAEAAEALDRVFKRVDSEEDFEEEEVPRENKVEEVVEESTSTGGGIHRKGDPSRSRASKTLGPDNKAGALSSVRGTNDFLGVVSQLSTALSAHAFRLPPYFVKIIRALAALEGVASGVDADFRVIERAYPYVLARVVADPAPETREVLRRLVLDETGTRVRWGRVARLMRAYAGGAGGGEKNAAGKDEEEEKGGGFGSAPDADAGDLGGTTRCRRAFSRAAETGAAVCEGLAEIARERVAKRGFGFGCGCGDEGGGRRRRSAAGGASSSDSAAAAAAARDSAAAARAFRDAAAHVMSPAGAPLRETLVADALETADAVFLSEGFRGGGGGGAGREEHRRHEGGAETETGGAETETETSASSSSSSSSSASASASASGLSISDFAAAAEAGRRAYARAPRAWAVELFDAAAAPEAREMAAAFAAGVGRRATAENARKAAKKAALELARALG